MVMSECKFHLLRLLCYILFNVCFLSTAVLYCEVIFISEITFAVTSDFLHWVLTIMSFAGHWLKEAFSSHPVRVWLYVLCASVCVSVR